MQLSKEYYFHMSGLLWALNKSHRSYLEQHALDLDITLIQYPYLLFLYYYKGCKQEDIARTFKVDKCGVSRILGVLSDKGLVSREIDPNNRRSYILSLTDNGKKICEELIKWDNKWEETVFSYFNLSKEDFDKLAGKLFNNSKNFVDFIVEDVDYIK